MAGETVLIIEDRRENIVHLANNVLKPNGYVVITAMDGQRGLKRILADQPDLVIMDLKMPKMDGLEVLAQLKERQVDIPVILTTFYGSEQVAEQALRLGAVDYVVKPYKVENMLRAVQKALSARPAASPPAHHAEPEEVMPLTRQVERWMRDMNILNRVGKALVAQMEMDKVCTRTVEAAIYITRADHAFLFLTDAKAPTGLWLRSMRGPTDQAARLLREQVNSELAQQVLQTGQTVQQSSAAGDMALLEAAGEFLGSIIATPLRWQRTMLGVLVAARSQGEAAFGEADAEWLSGLAEYVTIAVRNARVSRDRAAPETTTSLDSEALDALRRDLDRLAEHLRAASETVDHLAARLADESHPPSPDTSPPAPSA